MDEKMKEKIMEESKKVFDAGMKLGLREGYKIGTEYNEYKMYMLLKTEELLDEADLKPDWDLEPKKKRKKKRKRYKKRKKKYRKRKSKGDTALDILRKKLNGNKRANYIKLAKETGYAEQTVRNTLIKLGWKKKSGSKFYYRDVKLSAKQKKDYKPLIYNKRPEKYSRTIVPEKFKEAVKGRTRVYGDAIANQFGISRVTARIYLAKLGFRKRRENAYSEREVIIDE